jgi:hypothetical protein
LIDDLPLRKGVDGRYLRLPLIGALFWFKKESDTPTTIAKQVLSMLVPESKTPNRSWVTKTSEPATVDAIHANQSAKAYSTATSQDACPECPPEVAS